MNCSKRLTTLLVLIVFVSGCATILTGTSDDIQFNSDPEGATVLIDGIERGTTPTTIEVDRPGFSNTQVTLKLDGYESRTFVLRDEFNAVSILNFGGILGWGVDIATGAVTKYSQTSYQMDLETDDQAFNLQELERGEGESYVIPSSQAQTVIVQDENTGLEIQFEK